MTGYQSTSLDLLICIALGLEMMRPAKERGWGRATELARHYNRSRPWLYELGARTKIALEKALMPGQASG